LPQAFSEHGGDPIPTDIVREFILDLGKDIRIPFLGPGIHDIYSLSLFLFPTWIQIRENTRGYDIITLT
jgi:hypothetical protein